LGLIETISYGIVRRVLKKNTLKPWLKEQWCIPEANAEFVARMEDLLDWHRPAGPQKKTRSNRG
jgi:hypothetical protein